MNSRSQSARSLCFYFGVTESSPSLHITRPLPGERQRGCHSSRCRQTPAIPWNSAKYLQPVPHTHTHTHVAQLFRHHVQLRSSCFILAAGSFLTRVFIVFAYHTLAAAARWDYLAGWWGLIGPSARARRCSLCRPTVGSNPLPADGEAQPDTAAIAGSDWLIAFGFNFMT